MIKIAGVLTIVDGVEQIASAEPFPDTAVRIIFDGTDYCCYEQEDEAPEP